MPNAIDISASSMTGLLGAVEASKAAHSLARKSASSSSVDGLNGEYDLSRYKRGSALSKNSSKVGDMSQRFAKGSNKGVKLRATKDKLDRRSEKLSAAPPSVQDQLAMEALERKSKIYEATILGKKGGLSEKQLEGCPLDVEAKRANWMLLEQLKNPHLDQEEDSDDECVRPPLTTGPSSSSSSSSSLPPRSFAGRVSSTLGSSKSQLPMLGEDEKEEEDWIETKDEFGRDVLVPASESKPEKLDPQHTLAFRQTESGSHLQDIGAHYGPQLHFPLLELNQKPAVEPIEKYFDPKAERRQLGTGFYALSSHPEERQRQQEELRAREAETNQARASASANQGHLQPAEKQLTPAQIALEARKRQLQLKREELARKRLKKTEHPSAI